MQPPVGQFAVHLACFISGVCDRQVGRESEFLSASAVWRFEPVLHSQEW